MTEDNGMEPRTSIELPFTREEFLMGRTEAARISAEGIEKMMQEKGLTAPKVTPGDVTYEFERAEKQFYVFPGTTVTVCCATLMNGFTLVGKSAAASPENFDEQIGRAVALKDAEGQLWAFLGFRLRDQLARGEAPET